MDYTVELSDVDGNACKVALSLPLLKDIIDETNSTWRTLDKGAIKFNSGGCLAVKFEKTSFSRLKLRLLVGEFYIITLFKFTDRLALVNSSGDGEIVQTACLNFKPGKITWALLE